MTGSSLQALVAAAEIQSGTEGAPNNNANNNNPTGTSEETATAQTTPAVPPIADGAGNVDNEAPSSNVVATTNMLETQPSDQQGQQVAPAEVPLADPELTTTGFEESLLPIASTDFTSAPISPNLSLPLF